MAIQRLTEVTKKDKGPKDSRFTAPKKKLVPKKESGTRLRGH